MESVYNKKENCCGCTACFSICPVSAINMQKDEKGFSYPVINKDICINCKKCVSVCPLKKKTDIVEKQYVFALKNKNEKIRETSSSGGFFFELANQIIKKNGVVYGAIFNSEKNVIHTEIKNAKEIKELQGSKYVQSDIRRTYIKAEENLKQGKLVLFSGTPCQILGLRNYIGKEYKNLITCDIICHGVPSPEIFNEYKRNIEKKYNSKIELINFRYKNEKGIFNIKIELENEKTIIRNYRKDEYYFLFLKDYILRESCYNCYFSNMNRVSDITMGDFWGINKTIKNFDDGKGTSLIIVNTDKGMRFFNILKEKFYCEESNVKDCLQPNLIGSTKRPKNTQTFWTYYKKYGYNRAIKKIKFIHFLNRVKNKIKRTLK